MVQKGNVFKLYCNMYLSDLCITGNQSLTDLYYAAFLIKQAKDISKEQQTEGGISERLKQTNMKMLTTWLPLLCRASNGTDAPTLSTIERSELERALEKMIDMIEEKENQEKVLSLWLHHFAHCSSSDWPNLYGSYIRWCNVSRKLLLKAG